MRNFSGTPERGPRSNDKKSTRKEALTDKFELVGVATLRALRALGGAP